MNEAEMHRVTVNLTPRSTKSMTLAAKLTEEDRTSTVNRALQVYAYILHVISGGGDVFVREPGEEMTRIKVF